MPIMRKTGVSFCTIVLFAGLCVLISCQRGTSPGSNTSPLSPLPTPFFSSGSGQVYAAQIRGAWASGAPYPIFFFDVPRGTTEVKVQKVIYGTQPPLGGVHPRLIEVSQNIVWPGGATAQLLARDFVYDENSGVLLMFNAFLDSSALDTAFYDVFSCAGVGLAYLGNAGGVNVFYNCATPISLNYRELSRNEDGRPIAVLFTWECEGDAYEVKVEMSWGRSDPVYNIDVIRELTATITRY